MTPSRDKLLYDQAKGAVTLLMRHYRYGAFRMIRDPEGLVSLWAIEGDAKAPFSLSFVDRGRVYRSIDDVPPDFLKSILEYVQKTVR